MVYFVVIYLIRAREFVIVPENWVQGLNNAKLKNNGKNSNQNFLVFWSANNGIANSTRAPNFNADLDYRYHPTIDEVCYLGRVKKFFGKSNMKTIYLLIFNEFSLLIIVFR